MFMLVTLILLSNFKVIYRKRLHSTNEKANNMELINELNYMGKSQEKPNEMEVWGYTIAKRIEKLPEKKRRLCHKIEQLIFDELEFNEN